MNKLIKISDIHYIIVDDSEIKVLDWCLDTITNLHFQYFTKRSLKSTDKKITHSTQPLEYIQIAPKVKGLKLGYKNIIQISLSEIEEIINGFNSMILARESVINNNYDVEDDVYKHGFVEGFNVHKELVKDKLFSIEDLRKAFKAGDAGNGGSRYNRVKKYNGVDEYFKTFLNWDNEKGWIQTEWNIEIDSNNKISLL